MRKLIFLVIIFTLFLSHSFSFAQLPPEGINYQAVARDTTGKPISNSLNLKVKFTIWDSIIAGDSIFREVHNSVGTNRYGLYTLVIGNGILISQNSFSDINWANGKKFLEVAVNHNNTGFVSMPYRTQMMSVPYALYAKSSGGGGGTGATGSTGVTGVLGVTGISGTTGATGASGFNGSTGATGLDGALNAWSLTGNTSTSTSTNYIGTTDNAGLPFRTNGIQRMIIDPFGKVGIGTTGTPSAVLDVNGTINMSGSNNATSELNRAQTGTANLVPIAYGNISADGNTIYAKTPNIAVVWDSGNSRYKISITGELYSATNYITMVTPIGGNVKGDTNDDGVGNLIITFYQSDMFGTPTQNAFQFITYKP